MSAVVKATELVPAGVIFILKNRNNGVNIDHTNLLHPFYMVYLSDEGKVRCNHLSPKRLLGYDAPGMQGKGCARPQTVPTIQ